MPARAPLQMHLVKLMRWAALLSLASSIVALTVLARGESEERAYEFIATSLGIGLAALLGIGFLMLLFIRNRQRSGAADSIKKETNEPRS